VTEAVQIVFPVCARGGNPVATPTAFHSASRIVLRTSLRRVCIISRNGLGMVYFVNVATSEHEMQGYKRLYKPLSRTSAASGITKSGSSSRVIYAFRSDTRSSEEGIGLVL